jgi:hypothetical protein
MAKKQQGISQRAYAKLAGIRPSYVQRLVAEGKLPTLSDGSLDRQACDEARKRTTVVGKGQRRWSRRHGTGRTADERFRRFACLGCGENVSVDASRDAASPDPERFCTPKCAEDVAAGLTRAQIRRKVARGE